MSDLERRFIEKKAQERDNCHNCGQTIYKGASFFYDRHLRTNLCSPRCMNEVEEKSESNMEIYPLKKDDPVNHPSHYGGDTPYEAIKVIEAWGLGFSLGNCVKYISRAGRKDSEKTMEDLEKAKFYLDREIKLLKGELEHMKHKL